MTRALASGTREACDRSGMPTVSPDLLCDRCTDATACETCAAPSAVTVTAGMNTLAFCATCHAGMLADHANGLCLGCREMRGTCANGCEPIGPSDFSPIVEA